MSLEHVNTSPVLSILEPRVANTLSSSTRINPRKPAPTSPSPMGSDEGRKRNSSQFTTKLGLDSYR